MCTCDPSYLHCSLQKNLIILKSTLLRSSWDLAPELLPPTVHGHADNQCNMKHVSRQQAACSLSAEHRNQAASVEGLRAEDVSHVHQLSAHAAWTVIESKALQVTAATAAITHAMHKCSDSIFESVSTSSWSTQAEDSQGRPGLTVFAAHCMAADDDAGSSRQQGPDAQIFKCQAATHLQHRRHVFLVMHPQCQGRRRAALSCMASSAAVWFTSHGQFQEAAAQGKYLFSQDSASSHPFNSTKNLLPF